MPFNSAIIDQATAQALAEGHRVLQPYYFADNEDDHVALLLEAMNPPAGAHILDAGCGIGEVACLMHEARPDLTFTLLNANRYQLNLCPGGAMFDKVQGDFHAMPVESASVDGVMFNAAFCHGDPQTLLAEAARVTRDGGTLMLADMCRHAGDNAELSQALHSFAWTERELEHWADTAGFTLQALVRPAGNADHFRQSFANPKDFDRLFASIYPVIYQFKRKARMEQLFARHTKVALQFSGGKDSLACLFKLRDYWDQLTVYWLNTGKPFPETRYTMDRVRALVPNFVEITSNQPESIKMWGIPSDIVPSNATQSGLMAASNPDGTLIQDRYTCCYRVLMLPLHQRMQQDGMTAIIRGQKNADGQKAPIRNGHIEDGIEYCFPIEGWTDAQVMDYLQHQEIPLPAYYGTMASAPDCMDCSAWWEEGRAAYLKQHHPEAYATYQQRLDSINHAVSQHVQWFNREIA